MLMLSRKEREKIYIGTNVVITVAKIQGRYVRLGIECPREIPIYRSEVRAKIERDGVDPAVTERLAARQERRAMALAKLTAEDREALGVK